MDELPLVMRWSVVLKDGFYRAIHVYQVTDEEEVIEGELPYLEADKLAYELNAVRHVTES